MGNDICGQVSFFSFFCRVQNLHPQCLALLEAHLSPSMMTKMDSNGLMLHLSIEQFFQLANSCNKKPFFAQLFHFANGSTLRLRFNGDQTADCIFHLRRIFTHKLILRDQKCHISRYDYFAHQVKAKRFFQFSAWVSISELNSIEINKYKRVFLGEMVDRIIEVDMRGGTKMYEVSASAWKQLTSPPVTEAVILRMIRELWKDKRGMREIIASALQANSDEVDLLVEDIYGSTQGTLNLPGKLIAASLGKVAKSPCGSWSQAPVAKSLLMALAINLANTLSLYAHKCPCILYVAYEIHEDQFYLLIQSILKMYAPQAQIWFLDKGQFQGCFDI